MALQTVNLACTQCAMVDSRYMDANYHGAADYNIAPIGTSYYSVRFLLQFEAFPAAYKYRSLYSANLSLTINRTLPNGQHSMYWQKIVGTFDETTVTFNNKPYSGAAYPQTTLVSQGSGNETITLRGYSSAETMAEDAKATLNTPAFFVATARVNEGESIKGYTRSSSYPPVLVVGVSDTPYVRVTTNGYQYSTIRVNEPQVFEFDVVPQTDDDVIFADSIAITRASFLWRATGTSSWQTRNYSGDVRSVTVPTGVFPATGSIEWYIRVTLDTGEQVSGATVTSEVLEALEILPVEIAGVRLSAPDTTISWSENGNNLILNYFGITTRDTLDWLTQYPQPPASYRYRPIHQVYINFQALCGDENVATFEIRPLSNTFSSDTVTWANAPSRGEVLGYKTVGIPESTAWLDVQLPGTLGLTSGAYARMLRSPALCVRRQAAGLGPEADTHNYIRGTLAMTAEFGGTTVTSKPVATVYGSGYVNPHVRQTFSWELVPDGDYECFGTWTQQQATFNWRQGTSGNWTQVTINGASQAVNIEAGTMPVGTVQWFVSTTDDQGTTASSSVYTISTEDSTTTALPAAPIATIEAGDSEITFKWTTQNDNATSPSGSELQYSTDGIEWLALGSTGAEETEWTATAGAVPGGMVYWRVKSANADGVYGPWSNPVSFYSMTAAAAPIVRVTGNGFATVRWQNQDQEAFRVTVDGVTYGPFFGSTQSFELPEYLEPGEHSASVETQNSFGLWSKPGTVAFTVNASTGRAPVLTVTRDGPDAVLRWTQTATAGTKAMWLYRDGVRIAKLTGAFSGNSSGVFVDRFVLGTHTWQLVRNYNDYAILSNSVTLTLRSCVTRIAAFSGGPWIELKLSENEQRVEAFSRTRSVSLRHVTGSEYPVAEIGPYLDGSGSYDAAFQTVQELAAFETLFGQPVIIKSRGGQVLVGVLSNLSKRMGEFYIAVSFTLSRIHWRDYLDVSDS